MGRIGDATNVLASETVVGPQGLNKIVDCGRIDRASELHKRRDRVECDQKPVLHDTLCGIECPVVLLSIPDAQWQRPALRPDPIRQVDWAAGHGNTL